MKKMTKVLTTVLVIALAALTLAGCAKKDTSPVTTDGSTSMEKVIRLRLRHPGRLRRPLRHRPVQPRAEGR